MILSYLTDTVPEIPPSDLFCLDQDPNKSLRSSHAKPVIMCVCSSMVLHYSVDREISGKRENSELSSPTCTEMC